jgi:hypothetical protein
MNKNRVIAKFGAATTGSAAPLPLAIVATFAGASVPGIGIEMPEVGSDVPPMMIPARS